MPWSLVAYGISRLQPPHLEHFSNEHQAEYSNIHTFIDLATQDNTVSQSLILTQKVHTNPLYLQSNIKQTGTEEAISNAVEETATESPPSPSFDLRVSWQRGTVPHYYLQTYSLESCANMNSDDLEFGGAGPYWTTPSPRRRPQRRRASDPHESPVREASAEHIEPSSVTRGSIGSHRSLVRAAESDKAENSGIDTGTRASSDRGSAGPYSGYQEDGNESVRTSISQENPASKMAPIIHSKYNASVRVWVPY